jgi:phosphoglycerate dehydrogenase-like enzyme
LEEVAAHSDIVSLHATYRPGGPPLIHARIFARLRPAAVIVNTARLRLIDEQALIAALDAGAIAGAALDVLSSEPPPSDHALRAHPRVVLTPHFTWF